MTKIPFRTAYGEKFRQPFETTGPSRAHQSFKAECDINTIMQRYEKTGILEHRNNFQGQYGDFTDTPSDYQESLNIVLAADEMFSTLPAGVRRRFHNDAGAFIDFAGNPQNRDELVKLGLATPHDVQVEVKAAEGAAHRNSKKGGGEAAPKEPPKEDS